MLTPPTHLQHRSAIATLFTWGIISVGVFLMLTYGWPFKDNPTCFGDGCAGATIDPGRFITAPANFARLPMSFEPNRGQADSSVRFLSHTMGGLLYFSTSGVAIATNPCGPTATEADCDDHTIRMEFVGAASSTTVQADALLPGKVNYILGSDPSAWLTDLPTYSTVRYTGLYNGVDLEYVGHAGLLKGTYTVVAGADPTQIRWRYAGAELVALDSEGNLQIILPSRPGNKSTTLTELSPTAWQEAGRGRQIVSVRYSLADDGSVGLEFGPYDRSRPLTIDPVLTYSTYLGGSAIDQANGVAVDAAGNVYVVGFTTSSNFPTVNPFQPSRAGSYDAFITKFNAAGTALVYSTYLGGSSEDYGQGVAVDNSGAVYLTGYTASGNFPTRNPVQPNHSYLYDLFVTKLNPAGSDLVYSTYLGGSFYDYGYGIAVDSAGEAMVTGNTASEDFPTVNPLQPNLINNYDMVLSKFSASGTSLLYSTYLGGSGGDWGYAIASDAAGNAYVTGLDSSAAGIYKVNPAGSAIVYSMSLGGAGTATGRGIAVDWSGSAYVTGSTNAPDFPVVNAYQPELNGTAYDAFVSKLNPQGNALDYSTYLGGSDHDEGFAISVDGSGSAYITGETFSVNYPTVDPLQPNNAGGYDAFATKFTPNGSALAWSTYLGGSNTFGNTGYDKGFGIAADVAGNVYLVGATESNDFHTANPFQPSNAGQRDAFVVRIGNDASYTATPTRTSTATITPGGPTLTPTPGCPAPWTRIDSPNPLIENDLFGVAAISANDVWAVGSYGDAANFIPTRGMTLHWNGAAWSVVDNPVTAGASNLTAVAALASNDVWAVGNRPSGGLYTIHWDGTQWVNVPNPGQGTLHGVAAISSNDVWAVGLSRGSFEDHHPLAMHWNGSSWARVSVPPASFSDDYIFQAASATASNDVWAVGYIDTHGGGSTRTLIEHWDGTQWSVVPSPNPGSYTSVLLGVSAFSASDAWAVGYYSQDGGKTRHTLTMHWDGALWSVIPSHDPALDNYQLFDAVKAISSSDVWAVGAWSPYAFGPLYTLVEHWDGTRWGLVPSPNGDRALNEFYAVTALSVYDAWAVGASFEPFGAGPEDSLTARRLCIQSATATPATSTPTAPPPTSTLTSTPAGVTTRTSTSIPTITSTSFPTATATATACAIQFTDVSLGHTFYPYVRCLACRGIISGYPCGSDVEPCNPNNDPYFRPQNNVTRGQIAKIVSESAAYSDAIPTDRRSFEDVLPGSTFWIWIERAVLHGVVQGYPCGGTGEPCNPPLNRSYLRPGAQSTRGQLSKMVVIAAGMPINTTGGPHFTDVLSGHTFYDHIETLYNAGAINGYPDGTFRPQNNVTRGQTTKITSNAFFPSCTTR